MGIHSMSLNKYIMTCGASQIAPMVKNPPANAEDIRDVGSIPRLGRSPGDGHGNLLQDSCLENPMDIGAWRAIVHRVAEWAWLKRLNTHIITCVHHYNVLHNSFTFLKILCAPTSCPGSRFFFFLNCVHNFAYCRMSYSWNHIVHSLSG